MPERNFKAELLNLLGSMVDSDLFISNDKRDFTVHDVISEVESDSEFGGKIVKMFKHIKLKEKTKLSHEEEELLVELATGIMTASYLTSEDEDEDHSKKMVTNR